MRFISCLEMSFGYLLTCSFMFCTCTNSDYCLFTGDLLGPTVTGIERMLQMPFGCGEQILIGLGTVMYAAQYLQRTMRLSPPIQAQAVEQITAGILCHVVFNLINNQYKKTT